ncbi:hypothetical protein FSARC_7164 [Fusarium sarcochroum]|uniref:Uncharacterized protein n=1 Tax=Fusarium sarcochroum TaxID=1208366 RepID=A0A8H4TVP9_9HYPO|nr:hypothetical protein FSARC_7164 [Fusarium sarcochroum]
MPKHSGSRGNSYQSFGPYDRTSMYRGRSGGSTQPPGGGRGRGSHTPGSFKHQNKPHQGGITFVDSMSLRSIRQDSQSDPPGLKIVSNSKGGGRQDNIIAKVPGLQTTFAASIDNPQSLLDIYKMMPSGKLSIIVAVAPVGGNTVQTTTTELDWSVLQGQPQPQPPPSATNEEQNAGNDEQSIGDTLTIVADENETTIEPTYDAQEIPTAPSPGSSEGVNKEIMARNYAEPGSRWRYSVIDNATTERAHNVQKIPPGLNTWSPESTGSVEPTEESVSCGKIPPKMYPDLLDLTL